MHVVHVVDSIGTNRGGPSRSTIGLGHALSDRGCKVDLCTTDLGADFGPPVAHDADRITVHQTDCRVWKRARVLLPKGFRSMLANVARDADVIHSHCLWGTINNDAAVVAARHGIPHVISVRGLLQPRALRTSAWKKAIAAPLYAKRNLRRAKCLHALTDNEARSIRSYGLDNPVAEIPNGIVPTQFDSLPGRAQAEARWPKLRGRKNVLSLGRIHPIKGLPLLIEAWRRLVPRHGGWHLVIAGPDEDGHLATLEELISSGGMEDDVTVTGPVWGQDKFALLGAADAFVLPSLSEGFSNVLLEALACGLPMVITTSSNVPLVGEAGAGFLADPTVEALSRSVDRLLALSDTDRGLMGRRGVQLVHDRFTWSTVAAQMLDVYRWVCGQDDVPDCVLGR